MVRLTKIVLAAALAGSLALGSAPLQAQARTNPCAGRWFSTMKPADGTTVIHRRVRALVGCAVRAYHSPGGMTLTQARCIVDRESGGWPWAHSPTADSGLFQLHDPYWPGWRDRFLRRAWFPQWPPSPYVARANTLAAMGLSREQGLSPWGGQCV
jgi:hypothetical protein